MVDNRSSAQSPVDASPLRFLGTVWRGLSLSAIAVASGRALHLLFILALLPLALDLPSVSGAHLHLAFARAIPAAAVTTAAVALIAAAPLVLAALVYPGIGRGRAAGTAPISNTRIRASKGIRLNAGGSWRVRQRRSSARRSDLGGPATSLRVAHGRGPGQRSIP